MKKDGKNADHALAMFLDELRMRMSRVYVMPRPAPGVFYLSLFQPEVGDMEYDFDDTPNNPDFYDRVLKDAALNWEYIPYPYAIEFVQIVKTNIEVVVMVKLFHSNREEFLGVLAQKCHLQKEQYVSATRLLQHYNGKGRWLMSDLAIFLNPSSCTTPALEALP